MRLCSLRLCLFAVILEACSGAGSGGQLAVGGSKSGDTGGAAASGGAASTSGASSDTSGPANVGGSAGTGGSLAAAGSPATGGSTASGGASPTGGASAAGASTSSVGGAATGGAEPTGGKSSTGGTSLATGGRSTSGGASTSGGSTSAGGCSEATCGSHKWACWKMGTPPAESLPNPQSFTDLGNGTVRDNNTCLVWEKANPATQSDWQTSYARCAALAASNYGGFLDWRLPTRIEMASITDLHGSNGYAPAFTVTSGYYATGSYWYETITGQSTAGEHWPAPAQFPALFSENHAEFTASHLASE